MHYENPGVPVVNPNTFQRAICKALFDEPQDVLFIADQLSKGYRRTYIESIGGRGKKWELSMT